MTAGITFDTGGLIALDRNDRRVIVLLARAGEMKARVTVPATALAQAIRRPERQVRLARLIRQPTTDVVDLDRVDAVSVGRLLFVDGPDDMAIFQPTYLKDFYVEGFNTTEQNSLLKNHEIFFNIC